jgi:hypothetical protein
MTDSLEARSDMYGLGISRHCSQLDSSQQPMLPCHFQKTLMDNVDLSFSGLKASRGSNVDDTFCPFDCKKHYFLGTHHIDSSLLVLPLMVQRPS